MPARATAIGRAAATRTAATGRQPAAGRDLPVGLIWCVGDSKTNGTGDDTPPPLGQNGYPPLLLAALNGDGAGGRRWTEVSRNGIGGITTAQMAARIAQDV